MVFFFFLHTLYPRIHILFTSTDMSNFFLLLRYHIIFHTNELSKKVIDFPSIYTRRIGFFSKIEIFELNKKNQQQQQKTNKNQKTTTILQVISKWNRLVSPQIACQWVYSDRILCIDCKNKQTSEKIVKNVRIGLFLIC